MSDERASHPLAGKTVVLNLKAPGHIIDSGDHYRIEDWWDKLTGFSWMDEQGIGNPACLHYAIRAGNAGIAPDNDVVYGKVRGLGHLIHVSELGDEVINDTTEETK